MRVSPRPVKELKFTAIEGIIPEKQYVMRVRAINAIGISDPSDVSESIYAKDPDCKHLYEFSSVDTSVKYS